MVAVNVAVDVEVVETKDTEEETLMAVIVMVPAIIVENWAILRVIVGHMGVECLLKTANMKKTNELIS